MTAEFDPPEFDRHAANYDGGIDNSVKRMMGDADSFIAVKARWLMRREPGLRAGGLSLLDYGCGDGFQSVALSQLGARQVRGVDLESERLVHGRRLASAAAFGLARWIS